MSVNTPWGSEASVKFVTNVGLITSDGPRGPNVMSAEWTHHISYEPGIILISTRPTDTTTENIKASGEFGVNLAAFDQASIANIAGNAHGMDVDKMSVLKELGIRFYDAKTIKAPMIEGAALNAECKVIFSKPVGDHIIFAGEIQDVVVGKKEPLAYHGLKFWKLTERIEKPGQDVLDNIKALVEKYKRK